MSSDEHNTDDDEELTECPACGNEIIGEESLETEHVPEMSVQGRSAYVGREGRDLRLFDILPALKREDSSVGGSATDPRRQLAGLCALLWDFREGVVSPTSRGRPTRIARAVPSA